MKLIYTKHLPTHVEVQVGDIVTTDDEGVITVNEIERPRSEASTGRIYVTFDDNSTGGYYPSVFGAEWIEREDRLEGKRLQEHTLNEAIKVYKLKKSVLHSLKVAVAHCINRKKPDKAIITKFKESHPEFSAYYTPAKDKTFENFRLVIWGNGLSKNDEINISIYKEEEVTFDRVLKEIGDMFTSAESSMARCEFTLTKLDELAALEQEFVALKESISARIPKDLSYHITEFFPNLPK